jgi:hypothetical protein
MQNPLDFHLLKDPGASTSKVLLWRNGQVISHFITSSCDRITQADYLDESMFAREQWGSGVVKIPYEDGDRYYRVGITPVSATTEAVEKWQSTVVKLVCILGWLGRSAKQELRGSLRVLLPLDEVAYAQPLMRALAYALKNGAESNGSEINNVKLTSAIVLPEGSGFCTGHQFRASIISGHCDVSFLLGHQGKIQTESFTLSGAGAILPWQLSKLPVFDSEVDAVTAFQSQNWSYFTRYGLTLDDVKIGAEEGVQSYLNMRSNEITRISRVCEKYKVNTLVLCGGSAKLLGRLIKGLVPKIVTPKDIEDRIGEVLGIADKSQRSRLVDLFLVSEGIEEFREFYESGGLWGTQEPMVPMQKMTNTIIDVKAV